MVENNLELYARNVLLLSVALQPQSRIGLQGIVLNELFETSKAYSDTGINFRFGLLKLSKKLKILQSDNKRSISLKFENTLKL